MKKTILSITLFCLALAAFADSVTGERALSVAKQFMNASSATMVWDGTSVATKSGEDPAFYVFNISGGGWVIVSGEDSSTPVLGYSETGSFNKDNIPDGLDGWLGAIKKDIAYAREKKFQPTTKVKAMWANPKRIETKASGKVTLSTASWDQNAPYSNLLSTYVKNGTRGVTGLYTGCVATAMSEVLYYHKWPAKGTGTIGGYTTESKSYTVSSVDISSHTYDWSNMLSSYRGSYSTAQGNAVAQLMADCGIMVEMDYTTSGSGALAEDIIPALTQHMSYSKAATLKYRMDYTTQEWFDMIAYDIDNCGPILYGGVDGDNGGHEFVCDGYDTGNLMVHINWGWSGDNNGFFAFDLSVDSYTFNQYQNAVFGLVPDKDGSSQPSGTGERLEMDTYDSNGTTYYGMSVSSGSIAKGSSFMVDCGVIYNMGAEDYTGDLKVVMVDKDGNWKEDVSENLFEEDDTVESMSGFGLSEVECTITKDIALGDRLAFWFQLSDGKWEPVKYDISRFDGVWTLACIDANFIKVKDSYSSGEKFFFALVPGNKRISSISWSYDGSVTKDEYVTLSSGNHTVSAAITFSDKTTETLNQVISVK